MAKRLERDIAAQRAWIREHGSSTSGYLAYYAAFPNPYSEEDVRAIRAADLAYLAKLQAVHTANTVWR